MSVKRVLLSGVYFVCSILMYYMYKGGINIAGINFMYCYLAALAFVLITFGCFLVNPDIERMVVVAKFVVILSMPYLFSMFYSLIVWVLNLTPFRIMLRGFFQPSYQILAIFMAGSAVYLFGRDGIYYQLSALIAGYVLIFIDLMAESGVMTFLTEYVRLLQTFGTETGTIMAQVERVAYSHGMGLFLFYLFFTLKENKKSRVFLIPAIFLFLSGFKRSAMIGILSGIFWGALCLLFSRKGRKGIFSFFGCFTVIAGVLYIGLVTEDAVKIISEWLGIDTMGRSEIYEAVRGIYDYSVTYIGRGLGYVSYVIGSGLIDVGNYSRGDIHNDLLRQYIELGMGGFLIWAWCFFGWRLKAFLRQTDRHVGVFMAACLGYCFVCYMTENMYYRFNTNLALAVVILSYAVQRWEKRAENEQKNS